MTTATMPAGKPRWQLYVVPGEANSEKAIGGRPSGVHVVDARELTTYPPFLDGVPVLADNQSRSAYKGTRALEMLGELRKSELAPAAAAGGGGARTTVGSFSDGRSLPGPGVGAPVEPGPHGAIPTRVLDGRVQERDVAAYMEKRAQVTDSAVKMAQQTAQAPVPLGGDRVPPSVMRTRSAAGSTAKAARRAPSTKKKVGPP